MTGIYMAGPLLLLFVENLMAHAPSRGVATSGPGFAQATGNRVSRSAMGRYLAGEGNPSLEHIEALSKAVGAQPWELLRPKSDATPTVPQALDTIVSAIAVLPPDAQQALSADLALLARAPDSAGIRQRVLQALEPQEQSTTMKQILAHDLTTETTDFAKTKERHK